MKNTKRLLAVVLALVLCLSCLAGISFADSKKAVAQPATESEGTSRVELRGYKSLSFRAANSYRYADDEIVRAIVLLEGKALGQLPVAQRSAGATRLAAQHNTLRNALSRAGVSYTLEFEYDSLLNGIAISVAYGDLDKIAAIDGVEAVYIANHYAAPVLTPATRTASANAMTGANVLQAAGYKGEGMVIAVLDTGITPGHEAFQVYGETLADAVIGEADATAFISEKGYGTYLSQKIPFSYDYYDGDNDATDDQSGHGTHVSGIAAGYAETDEGEITFCGGAPYAQILAMKIFSSTQSGGTSSDVYFAALEDAFELGADVINMSIGAQNGNTYDTELEDEVFGNIYQTLEDNGVICSVAAGNEDSMAAGSSSWAGAGYVTSDYADYGVVGSPSTYGGNLSVASVENAVFPGYVLTAGEKEIPYYDADGSQFFDAMAGMDDVEYVVIDGYGSPEDFAGVDVKGKIALISRGEITFQEKVDNAAKAGASAAIIYNNADGIIYMSISPYRIPAVSITQEDGEYLKSLAVMPEEPADETPEAVVSVRKTVRGTADSFRRNAGERRSIKRDLQDSAVTSTAQLVDGLYLIGNVDGTKFFNGGAGADINKTGNYVTTGTEAAALTYSSADGSLRTADGQYIGGTSGSNTLVLSDTPVANAISFTAEGYAVITNNDTQFAFNADWDGFRFYKNTSNVLSDERSPVILYQLSAGEDPDPTPDPDPDPDPTPSGKGVVAGWYFENQDELADWSIIDADGDGYAWYWDDENGAAYEGSGTIYSMSWYNDALTPDDWAITPAVDLDGIEDAELSVWANSDPDFPDDVFALYAGTDTDVSTMTKLTEDITCTGTWTNITVDLSDFAGETIYVAIRHYNCSDADYVDIDNVEILSASVTPVEPDPEPEPQPSGDLIAGWYFESAAEVADWTVVDADGDDFTWNLTTGYSDAYEGTGVIYSESYDNDSYSALTPDNWAITPAVNLDGIEEATLSLWACGLDPSYASEVFAIYAGVSADPEAMTKLTDDITATGEWTNYTVDLSDFAGETIYIAIRHYNVTDQYILGIDQVEVLKGKVAPVEPEPVFELGGEVVKGFYFEEEPADWTFVDADGDGNNWIWNENATNVSAYEGTGIIYSKSYDNSTGALTPDNWAISPALDLSEIDDGVIALYACGQDADYAAENFAIYAGTSADPNTMVMISDGELTATGTYVQYYAPLFDFAGESEVYIAIRHFNITDMFYLNVDQVELLTGTNYVAPVPPEPVARPVGKVSFPTEMVILENPEGWQMSSFSSWGPTPDLTLKPQITGVGGDVYSASFNTEDGYEVMSGTSMATPNMTGLLTIASQYVQENYGGKSAVNPFTDVEEGRFYYEPVLWAVGTGVTTGMTETTFAPAGTCTRAQVVTFLWRAFGSPEPTATETAFTDLNEGAFYYKAVLWAVEKGITTGVSATSFAPGATCTRGQVVTFLWRALGKPAASSDATSFTDVTKGAYYYDAMLWAVENGVTNGKTATTFVPGGDCNRGEVVTFLYRALGDKVSKEMTKPERAALTEALAESTAYILTDTYGDPYSPRKQGAGLGDMVMLTAASAYIEDPIANLGDNQDGEFTFKFTVTDLSGEGAVYAVTPIVQSDYAVQDDLDEDETPETYNTLSALTLATEPYEYGGETYPADVEVDYPELVEVPANGSVEVTVTIKLTDATKAFLDAMFPNGTYVEGYILLDAVDQTAKREDETEEDVPETELAEQIHATFMGFYGDWNKAPILEQHDWREIVDANNFVYYTAADEEGNTYADYGYTYLDVVDFQVTTDVNTAYAINSMYYTQGQLYGGYAGDNLFVDYYDEELAYNGDHIAISPDGIVDMLYMTPYALRNTRHLIMVVTNAETGEIYSVDDTEYLPKAVFDTDYQEWVSYGTFMYDGTDAEGELVPSGTKVNITYYANTMYGEDALGAIIGEEGDYSKLPTDAKDYVVWEFPCTVDYTAPELVSSTVDEEAGTMTVTVKDDQYVAAVLILDKDGEEIASAYFSDDEAGAEQSITFEYGTDVNYYDVAIVDYATNETDTVAFVGDPVYVTINFAHPEGTELVNGEEEYVAFVGEKLPLPDLSGETEVGEFEGIWSPAEFDKIDSDSLIMYYLYGMLDLYFTGDTLTVTEDMDGMTLYPVYYVEQQISEGKPRDDEPILGFYFESDPTEEGWTFIDADGDGYNWTWDNGGQYSDPLEGEGGIFSASYDNESESALTPDNWAISPAIDLTGLSAASLSVWAVGQDADYCEENFAVYVGETADPDAMTKLGADITAEGSYINYVFDLSDYAGKTVYVAIRHYDVTDMFELVIDAVEVFDKVVDVEVLPEYEAYYTTNPVAGETPEPTGLQTGDMLVIYNPDAGMALSNADSDAASNPERYRLGVALDPETATEIDDSIIWTVEVADDGSYAFKDADGHYLSTNSYGNLILDGEYKYWNIEVAATEGCVYLISTEAVGSQGDPRGIEFYQGRFTTYYASETNLANSEGAFALALLPVEAE